MKPCAHLRIEYAEPDGPKSPGKCLDCGRFMPSLPNSPKHDVNPFRTNAKNRAMTIRQRPQRRKAAGPALTDDDVDDAPVFVFTGDDDARD